MGTRKTKTIACIIQVKNQFLKLTTIISILIWRNKTGSKMWSLWACLCHKPDTKIWNNYFKKSLKLLTRSKLLCFKCSYKWSHNRKKGIDAIKLDYQENSLYFTLFNVTHKENPAQISVFNFSSVQKRNILCLAEWNRWNSLGAFKKRRGG